VFKDESKGLNDPSEVWQRLNFHKNKKIFREVKKMTWIVNI
jgi:hypothetical protein